MINKDKQILMHILKYCDDVLEDIEEFGDTFEAFEAKRAFRNSVSMSILQIGELSNKLSKEFKDSTREEVPWRKIYNMRNHFAHGYGSMDEEMIWNTAISDVPSLKNFCERQLEQSGE